MVVRTILMPRFCWQKTLLALLLCLLGLSSAFAQENIPAIYFENFCDLQQLKQLQKVRIDRLKRPDFAGTYKWSQHKLSRRYNFASNCQCSHN